MNNKKLATITLTIAYLILLASFASATIKDYAAYYDFRNTTGSQANATDATGANNGTIVGTATTAKIGNFTGLNLSGSTSNYVKIASSNFYSATGYTLCLMINKTRYNTSEHFFSWYNTTNNNRVFFISSLVSPSNAYSFTMGTNGGTGSVNSNMVTDSSPYNKSQVVCATWNSTVSNGKLFFYINGTEATYSGTAGNYTGTMTSSSVDIWLGGYMSSSRPFMGQMSQVVYYKRQLSSDEIATVSSLLLNGTSLLSYSEAGNAADESSGRTAIETGITGSELSSPDIETDVVVYNVYLNGTQQTGAYDKFTTDGTHSWAFNYLAGADTAKNLANIAPVVYFWENSSLTSAQISNQVSTLINSTN